MTTNRTMAGENWKFDGSTITVRIQMAWKRRGGRKVIIAPDGGDAWAPTKPRPDETLIRALARAHRWRRLLDKGTVSIGVQMLTGIGVQMLTTPQVEEVAACPGSAQEGPARRAARIKALAERRAGGACVPTWASGGISCGS